MVTRSTSAWMAALCLVATAWIAAATHIPPTGSPVCTPVEPIHQYYGSTSAMSGPTGAGTKPTTMDGCPVYDGENEVGLGGGRLPGGLWSWCDPFAVDHHPAGVGNGAIAWDDHPVDVVFVAATDGPTAPHPASPCVTNGLLTSDPVVDPADCVGNFAVRGPGGVSYAGIPDGSILAGPNNPAHPTSASVPDCHGYDGYMWVFLVEGTYFLSCEIRAGGTVIVSTPISGNIVSGVGPIGGCGTFYDP